MIEVEDIPANVGTYALVLAAKSPRKLRIGKLGEVEMRRGFYVYVGSAFGPGGLAGRLAHHRRITSHPHWHIDYLRAACDLVEIWLTADARRLEHQWAKALARATGAAIPVTGFGSSDCKCAAHLFWFARRPSPQQTAVLGKAIRYKKEGGLQAPLRLRGILQRG